MEANILTSLMAFSIYFCGLLSNLMVLRAYIPSSLTLLTFMTLVESCVII